MKCYRSKNIVQICYPFIVKIEHLPMIPHGEFNGYVAISKDHSLYGKHYDDVKDINVHGGLTLSDPISEFKSCIKNAKNAIWLEDKPDDMEDLWVFGFDTCHAGDDQDNWPKERCIEETNSLLEQLKKLNTKKVNGLLWLL